MYYTIYIFLTLRVAQTKNTNRNVDANIYTSNCVTSSLFVSNRTDCQVLNYQKSTVITSFALNFVMILKIKFKPPKYWG